MNVRGPYNAERGKDDPHPSNFGERVRKVRLDWGWTQSQLGRALGTDPTTISIWENGRQRPSGVALAALAMLFRTTPEALAEGQGFASPPTPPAAPIEGEPDLQVGLNRDEQATIQVVDTRDGSAKPLEVDAGMMILLQANRAHRRVWIVLE
jgi:transcriptional regulator with XRE-family HTH domain